jgi:hypothetical protein
MHCHDELVSASRNHQQKTLKRVQGDGFFTFAVKDVRVQETT